MATFKDTDCLKEFIKINKDKLYQQGRITLSHGRAYDTLKSAMHSQTVTKYTSSKTCVIIVKNSHNPIAPTFTLYVDLLIPDLVQNKIISLRDASIESVLDFARQCEAQHVYKVYDNGIDKIAMGDEVYSSVEALKILMQRYSNITVHINHLRYTVDDL